jgi:chromosomal replication initiator protein
MYLAKQHTTNSLPEIGRKFSNRDHTTVIHAVKTVEQLMQKDEEMRKNINNIRQNLLSIN